MNLKKEVSVAKIAKRCRRFIPRRILLFRGSCLFHSQQF